MFDLYIYYFKNTKYFNTNIGTFTTVMETLQIVSMQMNQSKTVIETNSYDITECYFYVG